MAMSLVLVLSACAGGWGDRDGSSGFLGRILGGRGGDETAAQSSQAPTPPTATETAADSAEPQKRTVTDLSNQTAAGDLSKYETEAVAGSGSFSALFGNIFGRNRAEAPPRPADQAGAIATASGEPLVAADGTVYYPQPVQSQGGGGLVGYFQNLFKPDSATRTSTGIGAATFGRNAEPEVTLRVNRYIWTAALDVLAFMPLETVDPFSGVFTTGYGTPPGGNRAYRATVYVQDPALDARSLNVALESRGGGPVNLETTRAIEDAILTRARQLWIAENES
jgi:hypothetical protein